MRPAAYPRQNRSPSFQNDTSPCSSAAPNDFFVSQKMDYIEHFLSKFDDRLAKLELTAKSPREDRAFSSSKKMTENSVLDIDNKLRAVEDGLFFTKNETSKRLNSLENHIQDLTRKATYGAARLPESREEQQANVNEKIMSIERRVDGMDRRLEQLTNTLESFMQRIEGNLAASMRQQSGHSGQREVRRHETEEPLTEVKLLGSAGLKDSFKRFEETPQVSRRTPSRDVLESRERTREIPDQSGKRLEEVSRPQEKPLERSQRFERTERVEARKSSEVRIPLEEPVQQQPERKRDEVKYQERLAERRPLDVRVPPRADSREIKEIKSGLKSPDTERKRKNVSWCESQPSEGNVDVDSPQKRSKVDFSYNDGLENSMRRVSLSDSLNDREKERPRSVAKLREKPEDRYRLEGSRAQRTPSVPREEVTYEKYVRYPGDSRIEKLETTAENVEVTNVSQVENQKGGENKERAFEEKRRKIDEEIERRIGKQIELKKRADVAVEGQKKIYEKASQIEDDFKISPYSTEKSRDKEVVSRLVREKQMRNDLISKYSENAPESSRKSSKSPMRK